jgi:signal transduction histidine kinase
MTASHELRTPLTSVGMVSSSHGKRPKKLDEKEQKLLSAAMKICSVSRSGQ